MTPYEKWSLITSSVGHILVIGTILYAARSLALSKKDHDRKVKIETLQYLSALRKELENSRRNVISKFGLHAHPDNIKTASIENPEILSDIHKILNAIERMARDIDLYDREIMIEGLKFEQPMWKLLHDYVESRRKEFNHELYIEAERMFHEINNKL